MKAAAQAALLPITLFLIALATMTSEISPSRPEASTPGSGRISRDADPLEVPPPAPAAVEIEEGARAPASLPSSAGEFVSLREKALPTKDEAARIKSLLRDRTALREAFDRLGDADGEIHSRQGFVQFVQDALLDRENPEHDYIMNRTEELILADNLRPEHQRAHRSELAADKGELVLAYLEAHPERLEFLLSAAAGSPNIRVIENAVAVGERRRSESLHMIEELRATVSN